MFRGLASKVYSLWQPELSAVKKTQVDRVKQELLRHLEDHNFIKSNIQVYGDENAASRLVKQLHATKTPSELMVVINSPLNKRALTHTTPYYPHLWTRDLIGPHITWKKLEDAVIRTQEERELASQPDGKSMFI